MYSGGLDSYLISHIWKPDVKLYIDVGGSYSKEEISRLPKDVIIRKLEALSEWERDNKIIPLRNLYFILMATNFAEGDRHEEYEICLGATAGDRVLDKSVEFAEMTTDLLNYLYQEQWWTHGKKFRVNLDFKGMTKHDLIEYYLSKGGSLKQAWHESFSCYTPVDGKECWACKPCFRKFVTFFMQGMVFTADIERAIYPYIKTEIIPHIAKGTYGRGEREEADILTCYEILKQKYDRQKIPSNFL